MNLIVNVSENWAIGKNNSLLFHLSSDMKFFKNQTTGNIVVMGRKTLDSLPGGRALPNRQNIVLTRNCDFERENVTVCHSTSELKELLKTLPEENIYVMGGESLYRDLLPLCKTAYVTKVACSVSDADAFMPNLDEEPDWFIASESDTLVEKGLHFKFVTYNRK